MNRHFQDTKYYLKRAGTTAKAGIAEELSPLTTRIRALRGTEEDETPETRLERVESTVTTASNRAKETVTETAASTKAKINREQSEPTQ